jgi:molybdopterin synthase sulfur carrier subunit
MNLKIKYYGMLAEAVQQQEEIFGFSQETVEELLKALYAKHPSLEGMDFQVAQNNRIVTMETVITGTEIVLLPPFAGG